jgi:Zn-dependent protease with chaperone function
MAWISWIFLRPLGPVLGPAAPIAIGGFTYFARYLLLRLSVAMEIRADALARSHEAQDGTFARALAHLSELNLCPAVLPGKLGTHPQVYDRLVAAGITPDFPRPEPPETMSWHGYIPQCAFFFLLIPTIGKAVS